MAVTAVLCFYITEILVCKIKHKSVLQFEKYLEKKIDQVVQCLHLGDRYFDHVVLLGILMRSFLDLFVKYF